RDHTGDNALTEAPPNARRVMVHGSGKGTRPQADLSGRYRNIGASEEGAAKPRKGKDRSAKDPDPVTAAKRKIALALQGRDNGAEIDSPPRTTSDSGAGAYGPD